MTAKQKLRNYVKQDTALKGGFFFYDKKAKRIRNLTLTDVHKPENKKGQIILCADFVDTNKDKVDLDFYLKKSKGSNVIGRAIFSKIKVHKVNGEKRYKDHMKQQKKKSYSY